jgi:hypothetical protein
VGKVPVFNVLFMRFYKGLALTLQVGYLRRGLVPKLLGHPKVNLYSFGDLVAMFGSFFLRPLWKVNIKVRASGKFILAGIRPRAPGHRKLLH